MEVEYESKSEVDDSQSRMNWSRQGDDDRMELDEDENENGGAAAAASSASSTRAATSTTAAAASSPSFTRAVERFAWTDTSISASAPVTATRFDTLTPAQYHQRYHQRNQPFQHGIPIVVDNGSYDWRAGFATDDDPRLVFRNLIGRPRNRKEADFVLVGNQLVEGDQFSPQRIKVRSPFDQTLVTQFDLMEYLFDYTFHHLGLTTSIPHPIFMTEPIGMPNYCRGKMSELLFECYNVPGVGYGLGEMLGWKYNRDLNLSEGRPQSDGDCTGDALMIQCGYESSTILPILDSKPVFTNCSRLSVGGAQLTNYLTHSLLTIQQPQHQQQFNTHRIQELIEKYGAVVPENYNEELNKMALLFDINNQTVPADLPIDAKLVVDPVIIQLPYSATAKDSSSTADLQLRIERKEQQKQRLRNLMAERKKLKLQEDQEIMADWDNLRAEFQQKLMTPSEYLRQLKRRTFADEQDFIQHYDKLKKSLAARLSGETAEDAAAAAEAATLEKLSRPDSELYPLLSRPDQELTPDELKEKSKQKRAKAIGDQQKERRREKEARLLLERQQKEIEAQEYEANPEAFIAKLQQQKEAILASREERIRTEGDATGRRSLASKKRMALLAAMGGSGGSIETIEKMAKKDKASWGKEATFGMKDEDWKVYEDVRLPSEMTKNDSEDEREALTKLESKLAQYDPTGSSSSKTPLTTLTPDDFQVPLWVDRVKLPEFFFQPTALLGLDEGGLSEMIRRILVRFQTPEEADRVVKHVLVSGGSSLFPGFVERIQNELRMLRPFNAELCVKHARDPQLDAWKGAARWCRSQPFSQLFFTRAEWLEKGMDYLKEHDYSNHFMATPPDEPPELARKRKR